MTVATAAADGNEFVDLPFEYWWLQQDEPDTDAKELCYKAWKAAREPECEARYNN